MINIIKTLTLGGNSSIIAPLSQKTKVGIGLSKQTARTATVAVFLRAKSQSLIMSGWGRQPQGWAARLSAKTNLLSSAP